MLEKDKCLSFGYLKQRCEAIQHHGQWHRPVNVMCSRKQCLHERVALAVAVSDIIMSIYFADGGPGFMAGFLAAITGWIIFKHNSLKLITSQVNQANHAEWISKTAESSSKSTIPNLMVIVPSLVIIFGLTYIFPAKHLHGEAQDIATEETTK